MKNRTQLALAASILISIGHVPAVLAQALIVDHTCTDIAKIPEAAIVQAKATLHIAYGHTSHGSQLTTGMTGLVAFATLGGKGLALPKDIFAWKHGGANGALDLHDYAMDGDVGYYPDWVNNTRAYLNHPRQHGFQLLIYLFSFY